jgi:type VI secretion system secreted protein VgrG
MYGTHVEKHLTHIAFVMHMRMASPPADCPSHYTNDFYIVIESAVAVELFPGGVVSMPHTVTVSSPAMPEPPLEFFSLSGGEMLSELYFYTIMLKTPGNPHIPRKVAANADYKQLVGKEFTVTMELADLSKREISGLVISAQIVESNDQQTLYEVVIAPWLILATRTSDYKRYQGKTVVQIIDEVLSDYNFPVEKRLSGSYPELDYQVQYGETDFDFIQRLMQEWGVYWFFEHSKYAHRLILIDDISGHNKSESSMYHKVLYNAEGKIDEEHLSIFSMEESHQPGQWVTNDFDFKKPLADLEVRDVKPRKTGFPKQELYEWPGDYTEADIGKRLAEVRMYAAGVAGSLASASGSVRGLPCGYVFELTGHPTEKVNREYLIVFSRLEFMDIGKTSGQSKYRCNAELTLLPSNKVFKAARTVSKPFTRGPQTAVVVGPPGEEIYTDQYGRIKVQFHWDRYGKKDQSSSCWIRVSYPWSGSNFGGIHIPRIGQEVIVDFENGDPDRPIVVGRVYNAVNMPPWDLPGNMTQSGVLSRSSHGGVYENANALRFEDKKGEEQVWLHAEKNQDIEVEHDETHWVGNDRAKTIDHDETNHIKHDRTETVDNDETITIHNNRKERVDHDEKVSIGDNRNEDVGKNESVSIGKNRSVTVGANKSETVHQNKMETIFIAKALTVGVAYQQTIGALMNTSVGLSQSEQVGISKSVQVGKTFTINAGEELKITVGKSELVMKSDGTVTINGTRFDFLSSGPVQITGKDINLN